MFVSIAPDGIYLRHRQRASEQTRSGPQEQRHIHLKATGT